MEQHIVKRPKQSFVHIRNADAVELTIDRWWQVKVSISRCMRVGLLVEDRQDEQRLDLLAGTC